MQSFVEIGELHLEGESIVHGISLMYQSMAKVHAGSIGLKDDTPYGIFNNVCESELKNS